MKKATDIGPTDKKKRRRVESYISTFLIYTLVEAANNDVYPLLSTDKALKYVHFHKE